MDVIKFLRYSVTVISDDTYAFLLQKIQSTRTTRIVSERPRE